MASKETVIIKDKLIITEQNHTIDIKEIGIDKAAKEGDQSIWYTITGDEDGNTVIKREELEEVYCHACSKSGGAEMAIYHLPPVCK